MMKIIYLLIIILCISPAFAWIDFKEYALSSDGYLTVTKNDGIFGANWDSCHDATVADSVDNTSRTMTVRSLRNTKATPNSVSIDRISMVNNGANIELDYCRPILARIRWRVTAKADTADNDAYSYFAIVESLQESPTALVPEDFDKIGDSIDNPTLLSDTIHVDNIIVGNNYFYLNEAGMNYVLDKIANDEYIMLGIREGHDIEDIMPYGSTTLSQGSATGWTANYFIPTGYPYLEIYCWKPFIIPILFY